MMRRLYFRLKQSEIAKKISGFRFQVLETLVFQKRLVKTKNIKPEILIHGLKRNEYRYGFTLLEIIIVMALISVLAVFAARIVGMSGDAKRYQNTIRKLELVRNRYLGDERIIQAGRRFDFGHYNEVGVPGNLDQLGWYWPSPDPFVYAHDEWGQRYTAVLGGPNISITSPGSPRAGAGAFAQDIFFSTRISDFDQNSIRIYCKDVNGTLLLGVNPGIPQTANYHIQNVTVEIGATTLSYLGGSLPLSANGFWSSNAAATWGPCRIIVRAADGTGGTQDWRPYLTSLSLGIMEFRDVICPKGGFANNQQNVFVIRLPGSASAPGAPVI